MPTRFRDAPIRPFTLAAILALAVIANGQAGAFDIAGVLPNSIGLPEVNVVLRPSDGAAPLSGLDSFGFPLTNLRMVYDTGASGVVLYEGPALALAVAAAQSMGVDVEFEDVGVGGSTTFGVSDPTHLSLGAFVQEPPDPYSNDADYPRQIADLRLQLGPPGSATFFLSDFSLHGIVGVPGMHGLVALINPKLAEVPLDELTIANTIHTHVYEPGVPPESGPGLLSPDVRVELTLQAFDRFTTTTPTGSAPPTLFENPFIGPDPLAAIDGVTPLPTLPPGITLRLGGSETTGTFLLDTGSQISSISSATALDLGIRRWGPGDPGYDPATPERLVFDADGAPVPDQFTVDISGIGGTETLAGFYADSLLIRTLEGDPLDASDPAHLDFIRAPVYVQDIELVDPVTLDIFTFDGILGTNYLFGSGDLSALSGFEVPFREGPFEWLVLDLAGPTPTLGVVFAAPAPAVPTTWPLLTSVLLAACGTRLARRRDRRPLVR